MKFLVIERVKLTPTPSFQSEFTKVASEDLKYKVQLEKKRKIVGGGPFLDSLGDAYILETDTLEEMGEILFSSPSNFGVEREVHPLGTFADSLEGMEEIRKSRR